MRPRGREEATAKLAAQKAGCRSCLACKTVQEQERPAVVGCGHRRACVDLEDFGTCRGAPAMK